MNDTRRRRRNEVAVLWLLGMDMIAWSIGTAFLPLYFQELGIGSPQVAALWAGIAISAVPLGGGLLGPLWGRISDRFGPKVMIARSEMGFFLSCVLCIFVRQPWQLLAARCFCSPFSGLSPLCMAFLSQNAPERAAQAIGNAWAIQWSGAVVGPLVGSAVINLVGLRGSFVVSSALYALLIGVFLLIADDRGVPRARRQAAISPWRLLRLGNVPVLMAALFTVQFVDKSFGPTLPLLIGVLESDERTVVELTGALTAAGSVTVAVAAVSAAALARRLFAPRLLILAAFCGALACAPIPIVTAWWQLLALRLLVGLPAGLMLTLAYTLAGQSAAEGQRGALLGVVASGSMFGSCAGPLFAGLMAVRSLGAVFVVGALLYGACALALLRLIRPGLASAPAVARSSESMG